MGRQVLTTYATLRSASTNSRLQIIPCQRLWCSLKRLHVERMMSIMTMMTMRKSRTLQWVTQKPCHPIIREPRHKHLNTPAPNPSHHLRPWTPSHIIKHPHMRLQCPRYLLQPLGLNHTINIRALTFLFLYPHHQRSCLIQAKMRKLLLHY